MVVALRVLGTYAGTLAELIEVAAQVAGHRPGTEELSRQDAWELAGVDAESAPAAAAPALGPAEERTLREELEPLSTLAAAHFLRALVPGAPVPHRPRRPGHPRERLPLQRPRNRPPRLAARRLRRPRLDDPRQPDGRTPSGLDAYRHGFVAPSEMVTRVPAREMNPVPKGWRTHRAEGPQLRAARALVAERLGTDTGRWLRARAAVACRASAYSRATRTALFDLLLEEGLITGTNLVHHAAGAAGVLHYLAEAPYAVNSPPPSRPPHRRRPTKWSN